MPQIDPTVLADHAALEASHVQYIQTVQEAEAAGKYVQARAARTELVIFEALFCEPQGGC